ncbi:MAG: hypothetical protein Q7R34_08530, partial [Dehalococcoidia bacterium]|nr:hypothetical protein [Dehalococcoidia bacterium]
KDGQKLAELYSLIKFSGNSTEATFGNLLYYPTATWTFYVSTTTWQSWSAYAYYPSAGYISSDPSLVNALEWHRLLYSRPNITGPVTDTVDYTKLVKRKTFYSVANSTDLRAKRWDFVYDPIANTNQTFMWDMTAPQTRNEWLSPMPAYYQGGRYQGTLPSIPMTPVAASWWFNTWYKQEYATGAGTSSTLNYYAGLHPLRPGYSAFNVVAGSWSISGSLMADTSRNYLGSNVMPGGRNPGHIEVFRDGVLEKSSDVSYEDYFSYSSFSATPVYQVNITATSPLNLSTRTETIMTFKPNPAADSEPPRLMLTANWDGSPTPVDLSNRLPPGIITMRLNVTDGSSLSTSTPPWLKWSTNDGASWNDVVLSEIATSTYQFSLPGIASGYYLSFWTKAIDNGGNSTEYKVMRSFIISGQWATRLEGDVTNDVFISLADAVRVARHLVET